MQTECLIQADEATQLHARIRFLHMQERTDAQESPWTGTQEAIEREVAVPAWHVMEGTAVRRAVAFTFGGGVERRGDVERRHETISGEVALSATRVNADVLRLTLVVRNTTPFAGADDAPRSAAALRCLSSTHCLLRLSGGTFYSLADPPQALRAAAEECRNLGAWPALVSGGEVLASPIILSDFPRIAPESRGDLFDGTEIDELLTLRILTLTDEEKRQARESDPKVAAMLDRVEARGLADVAALHGAVREDPLPGGLKVTRDGRDVVLKPGDKVRLHPAQGGDIFDLALAGKVATVETIEVDFEDRAHVAVTVDDDPGRDLGRTGQPGHRFFFHPHEVEPL